MVLVSYRDPRCHASAETIRQAPVGNHGEEHIFALTQALESRTTSTKPQWRSVTAKSFGYTLQPALTSG